MSYVQPPRAREINGDSERDGSPVRPVSRLNITEEYFLFSLKNGRISGWVCGDHDLRHKSEMDREKEREREMGGEGVK